ncbi:MAG: DUF4233 domain-containing protein [Corynebacterium flavescens]|uniref:DUF4233 domain-containing protein n=1 Tax=Corynebacterium flavescens TaxID=28028 RepID=UPI00264A1C2F|nr:DUF4233 domain-containing protein [Corynebacterium flavescens]MDN6235457.1 DUF4233 domain-containing protein [Corynebacterium flavescens]
MSNQAPEEEISPLGLGHVPVKDPIKSFNGMVIASSLTMEVITLILAFPLLYKLYDGTLWTPFNIGVVGGLVAFHLIMLAFVSRSWALFTILVVQVLGIVLGLMVHWSVAAIMVVFGLEWLLAAYLRSSLIARMKRGYLTTQHLNKS